MEVYHGSKSGTISCSLGRLRNMEHSSFTGKGANEDQQPDLAELSNSHRPFHLGLNPEDLRYSVRDCGWCTRILWPILTLCLALAHWNSRWDQQRAALSDYGFRQASVLAL